MRLVSIACAYFELISSRVTCIWLAVSKRMAKCEPLMLSSKGSPKGAICTNSTEFPGKQPISRSFNGIASTSNWVMVAFSPFFNWSMVICNAYLDWIKIAKVGIKLKLHLIFISFRVVFIPHLIKNECRQWGARFLLFLCRHKSHVRVFGCRPIQNFQCAPCHTIRWVYRVLRPNRLF